MILHLIWNQPMSNDPNNEPSNPLRPQSCTPLPTQSPPQHPRYMRASYVSISTNSEEVTIFAAYYSDPIQLRPRHQREVVPM